MADKKTSDNARIGEGKPGPGRPKGCANKATAAVREAIARVLDTNAENFGRWLASVAEGEKESATDRDGKPIVGDSGEPQLTWLRKPDPGLAVKLAMDMAEYHIPKLARTETTVEGEVTLATRLVIKRPANG
jgi:hypothetical protein